MSIICSDRTPERYIVEEPDQGTFLVNRHAFVDKDVLATEREVIFDRCWLYLGHGCSFGLLYSQPRRALNAERHSAML